MAMLCRVTLLLALLVVALGLAVVGVQYPWICLLLIAGRFWRQRHAWGGSGSSYGTARLANLLDLAGMLSDRGLILGRASLSGAPSRWHAVRCLVTPGIRSATAVRMFFAAFWRSCDRGFIRVTDYVHLLTVAPSGAGKSVAVLITNLLSYMGSCVVIDPKGELFKATAEFRRQRFGHKIIRLDPFGVAGPQAGPAHTLNPLDHIDENDPGFRDELVSVADMMVVRTGKETDTHWNDWSVVVLSAFMSFVCGCESDATRRNLGLVRDMVSSRHVFGEAVKAMREVTGFGGTISRFGELLGWPVDKELSSIMSSVQRHSSWMDGPQVQASLASSTFDPRWLRSGMVTVYLILPSDKLTTLAPLMRLWLGTIIRVLTKNGPSEKNPVLFLVDEAAHLGQMRVLQDAITLMRGYGIRLWLFFQSIDQIKTCYGDHAGVIIDNTATHQYFGITSYETAEAISKRIGDGTILVQTRNGGTSRTSPTGSQGGQSQGGSYSSNQGYSVSEVARRVAKPEEILVLPDSVGLVFHKNRPPIAAEMVRYFNAPEFQKGGTGRQPGPGLAALAASLLMLLASGVFALLMLALPSPDFLRETASGPKPSPDYDAYQPRRFDPPGPTLSVQDFMDDPKPKPKPKSHGFGLPWGGR